MTSLVELFQRDPLNLSDKDIDHIVEEMRANRKHFKTGEAKGLRANATKPKALPKDLESLNLDLDLDNIL